MKPIIIIGTGLAGYSLAREFRKLDKTAPLIMITADDGGFYSKPMLSNAFTNGKLASQLVSQSAFQMAEQINAKIFTATQVTCLNTAKKCVNTGAENVEYDKLVLAVGARAIQLPIRGDAADQVISVNHINDYAALRTRMASHTGSVRITILGAGLIGCEFADDMAGAGHMVTMIDPNQLPLAALSAPALSRGLQAALIARGITLRLGITATDVSYVGDALGVTLADGTSLETDIVLSAVGLRPDLALAQEAQLLTKRGIVVNTYGQTSAQDVYALGDCAEYSATDGSGRVLPYIAPLQTAARAIARTLSGQATTIDLKPAPVIVKTPSYPMALIPPPIDTLTTGEWRDEIANERSIARFFDAKGVMQGFTVSPHESGIRQSLLAMLGT